MTNTTGAFYKNGNCTFTVWAPQKEKMILHLVHPSDRIIEMEKDECGYFTTEMEVRPGARYFYQPDHKDTPDPASFFQPDGVHNASEIVDHSAYQWTDANWKNHPLEEYVIYELHIGTFTTEGTFDAAIGRIDDLIDIGVNAVEIMPVAQFPGNRNWGYDGAYPYAVQNSYGGPDGLKRFVDACHNKGIAVILDVVYNHLGPEGCYLGAYAPYFTDKYKTPWGQAINYDEQWSDGVRNYFCNNALYWLHYFHIDALRLDAIHEMYDFGAAHFWNLLHDEVEQLSKRNDTRYYLIAESDLNNPKVVQHPEAGGYGFHAQWLDDFHHALYVLTDENGKKSYSDFGSMEQLAKAYTDGFVSSGEYVAFRKRKYGKSSAGIPGSRFVVFNQNHDQVGNRVDGARLSTLVNTEVLKVAAAAMLLSPYIPMLFMGEEYGEDNPFYYFVSHNDEQLIEAVRKGRKDEFATFNWKQDPADPFDEKTFISSKLSWEKKVVGKYAAIYQWHRALIALRKNHLALRNFNKDDVRIYMINDRSYALHRKGADGRKQLIAFFNLSAEQAAFSLPSFTVNWKKILDSNDFPANITARDAFPSVLGVGEFLIPATSAVVYCNES